MAAAHRFQVDLNELMAEDENQSVSSPLVLWNGPDFLAANYSVVVDNVKVCSTSDLILSFKVLICTYYIFNLVYPKAADTVLIFYQKGLMNLQDRAPYNKKVSNFLMQINRLSCD